LLAELLLYQVAIPIERIFGSSKFAVELSFLILSMASFGLIIAWLAHIVLLRRVDSDIDSIRAWISTAFEQIRRECPSIRADSLAVQYPIPILKAHPQSVFFPHLRGHRLQ
jgi:uncharacterized membrane protein